MRFSGKITNSFFSFLEKCNLDTSCFFEITEIPVEFLKDPFYWMEAREVENLLYGIETAYGSNFEDKDLIYTVGHNSINMECWGGFKEVLKNFKNFSEVLDRLDFFFFNFISPNLEIQHKEIKTDKNSKESCYCFDTNFNSEDYPIVKDYLAASLEAVPLLFGQEMKAVCWKGSQLQIYNSEQENLSLPLEEFQTFYPSKNIDQQEILKQLKTCENKILNFKQNRSDQCLEDSLQILYNIKKSLKLER